MIYAHVNIENLIKFRFGIDAVYNGVKTSGQYRRILRSHCHEAKQKSRTITFRCLFNDHSGMLTKCYPDGSIRMNVGQPYEVHIPNYFK